MAAKRAMRRKLAMLTVTATRAGQREPGRNAASTRAAARRPNRTARCWRRVRRAESEAGEGCGRDGGERGDRLNEREEKEEEAEGHRDGLPNNVFSPPAGGSGPDMPSGMGGSMGGWPASARPRFNPCAVS